jgi:Mg2+/Co2+ transporter CorB
MNINYADLMGSLEIMWKGMAGIFIVCGFIMVLTIIFLKILMPKEKKE